LDAGNKARYVFHSLGAMSDGFKFLSFLGAMIYLAIGALVIYIIIINGWIGSIFSFPKN